MDGQKAAIFIRSWMFSRAFSTSDRVFREYLVEGDSNIQAALLDALSGVRQKSINLDEEGRRKLSRRIRQLEESLVRRGALKQFTGQGKRVQEGLQ
jgi:hypothetical protein